jgi:hypothetical protein
MPYTLRKDILPLALFLLQQAHELARHDLNNGLKGIIAMLKIT